VPMCRPDLAGELRPPELARATVSRGNREAELEVMQDEHVMIESGERAQTKYLKGGWGVCVSQSLGSWDEIKTSCVLRRISRSHVFK
jgi:hypothetical protein